MIRKIEGENINKEFSIKDEQDLYDLDLEINTAIPLDGDVIGKNESASNGSCGVSCNCTGSCGCSWGTCGKSCPWC